MNKIKNKLSLLLLLLFVCTQIEAQSLFKLEYWFNDDYTNRKTIALSGGNEVDIDINTVKQPYGTNFLNYRVQDDKGVWSNVAIHRFFRAGSVLTTEKEVKIAGVRYWFDNDTENIYEHDLDTHIVDSIDSEMNIPIPESLSQVTASHTIYIQARDNRGIYSAPISKNVVITSTVKVDTVFFSETNKRMTVGDFDEFTATVLPENAGNKTLIWSSSDPAIVRINEIGEIAALKRGVVTITATSQDGGKVAKCRVRVVQKGEIVTESLSLNETTAEIRQGESLQLTATVLPTNSTVKTVTWKSSDTQIATVDVTGKITTLKMGDVTITAATEFDEQIATCLVKVIDPYIAVQGVSLNKTAEQLVIGETLQLSATLLPANATNKAVTWKSSDIAIATVDQSGKISAIKDGTVIITVTTTDSNKSADCSITIVKPYVAIDRVELNKQDAEISVGDSTILVATVYPDDATNKAITWKSSNTAVATVDIDGKVKAIAKGLAAITVETVDSKLTAMCIVSVNAQSGINSIEQDGLKIYPNPVKDHIKVQNASGSTIKILDMNSSLIIQRKISSESERIEMSHVNKGVYLLQVEKDNQIVDTIKIIKE